MSREGLRTTVHLARCSMHQSKTPAMAKTMLTTTSTSPVWTSAVEQWAGMGDLVGVQGEYLARPAATSCRPGRRRELRRSRAKGWSGASLARGECRTPPGSERREAHAHKTFNVASTG